MQKALAANKVISKFNNVINPDDSYNGLFKEFVNIPFGGSIVSLIVTYMSRYRNPTYKHSQRVKKMSLKLGKKVGLSDEQLYELELSSFFHDIGKLIINKSTLYKPASLSERERELVHNHPEIGYKIATFFPELEHLSDNILYHHEMWDGNGYPYKLRGEEIPICSRIISVADAYDAMTHDRTYKKAIKKEDAVAEIIRQAGIQFDPELATFFVEKCLNINRDNFITRLFAVKRSHTK